MVEERNCYIHKEIMTRLSCVACGKPICPKCVVNAHIGYKCQDCSGQKKITPVKKITKDQYIYGLLSGLIIGICAGFIWNYLNQYGVFVNLLTAYAVGFCITKTITKTTGNKISLKLQVLAGVITIISMAYNPIVFCANLAQTEF